MTDTMPTAPAPKLPKPGAGDGPFTADLGSRVGTYIKQAEQALMAEKARVLRPLNLTVPQYMTLLALYYVPGQSAAQLARTAFVSPQTMTTILTNLQAKDLISRTTSAIHNKVLVTSLTNEGKALLQEADRAARAVEIDLASHFTEPERTQLRDLLERAANLLRAAGQ